MNTKQDKWIDEVMGSLQNMRPVEGNPHLHTRIIARLSEPLVPVRKPVQLKWVYSFSAAFVVMLFFNVLGWSGSFSSSSSESTVTQQPVDIETVISDYGLESTANYTSLP